MKTINEGLLPKEVVKEDFNEWSNRFLRFVNDKMSKHWLIEKEENVKSKCTIEISSDTPIEEYGLYSPERIKEMVKDIIDNNIPNSNGIMNEIDELEELNEQSLYALYARNESPEFHDLKDKLIKIIKKMKFNDLVLGRYYVINDNYVCREGKIVLYVNNIIKCYPKAIKAGFEQTFVHEFFHHVHNCVSYGGTNLEEFYYRKDYPSKVIKEALARFVELNYMKYYYPGFDYNECMSKLKNYSVSVYPYSGAAYIKDGYDINTDNKYDTLEEFAKIYNMSFNEALYYLLYNEQNREEYYDVLNHDYDFNQINVIQSKRLTTLELNKKSTKDYSKYEFNGKNNLTKGRLVLEVVKKYCLDNNPASFKELEQVFPRKLQSPNGKGVIALENTISIKDKGIGPEGKKRYFVDEPIRLANGEVILVCSQWGIGNIYPLIEYAKAILGYDIKTINKDLLSFITSNEKLDLIISNKSKNNINNFKAINHNIYNLITVDYDGDKENFLDMFERILDEKGYSSYKVEQLTGVDRKTIMRIKNAEVEPSKITLIKICIGLNLDLETGTELLRKADYSVNDNYIDRLFYKCLKDGITNKIEIDDTLEAAGYKPLFRKDNE